MQGDPEPRSASEAMLRGLAAACPRCGEGRLFAGYLAVAERCAACGEPLGEYRAADGPAFFTITIVGLLLVPALGLGFAIFRPDPWVLLAAVAVFATVLTLVLLRLVKGVFVAYLWAQDSRDPGA